MREAADRELRKTGSCRISSVLLTAGVPICKSVEVDLVDIVHCGCLGVVLIWTTKRAEWEYGRGLVV